MRDGEAESVAVVEGVGVSNGDAVLLRVGEGDGVRVGVVVAEGVPVDD